MDRKILPVPTSRFDGGQASTNDRVIIDDEDARGIAHAASVVGIEQMAMTPPSSRS